MKCIDEIYIMLKNIDKKKIAVAAADDEDVLSAVLEAKNKGIADFILFGNKEQIKKILRKINSVENTFEIVNAESIEEATRLAVECVDRGNADIIMKGLVDTGTFMREVLNKKNSLKGENNIVSSIAIAEIDIEGKKRIFFITDPGFIPFPDLVQKEKIMNNAVKIMHRLGYERPVVAIISPSEHVNPKIISTVEAKELEEKYQNEVISDYDIMGPVSLDLAVSQKSALHKGYNNSYAGLADLLLVPNLEVGNVLIKAITYFSKSEISAIVAGAKVPIIFTSRSDTSKTKLNTIAFAVYLSEKNKK